ncbi:MAG: M10 family metallopeptidase C-terminal domain-containing protein, partial [Cyanobium sp.]
MAVDWLALDAIYSSSGYGTANAFGGDTIYGVGTTISAAVSRLWNEFSVYIDTTAYTIVDGGGYDTLDVSNFSVDQFINLAPSQGSSSRPSLSNIGGKIGNLSIAVGTILEAAIGGAGNDSFIGNDAANTFRGGGGNDLFLDSLGSDTYYGDADIDTLTFTESLDLFSVSEAGDSLLFSRPFGNADVDRVWNGLENLSFAGVATTYALVMERFIGPPLPTPTLEAVNGSLTSGAITNATTLQLSGSLNRALSADQTISVYRDGVGGGSATPTAPGSTSWSLALEEPPGARTVTYTARVLEPGRGRSGLLSGPFQLTIDSEAPVVSVTPLETQSLTPLLSGRVSEAAEVTVTIGGVQHAANRDASGGWSLTWSDPLTPGQIYDVIVEARDAAGNVGRDGIAGELHVVPDDLPGNANTGALLGVGGTLAGALELAGDRDWVAVTLEARRTYAFALNGTTLADPLLRLRDARGLEIASNNDLSPLDRNALIRFTPATSGRFFLEAGANLDAGSGTYSLSATDVTPPPILFFSLQNPVTTAKASVMGGLTARANDIVAFDGSSFRTWLNGNDSGLAGAVLRDFHIVNDNEVVVAFQNPVTLAGIAFDD